MPGFVLDGLYFFVCKISLQVLTSLPKPPGKLRGYLCPPPPWKPVRPATSRYLSRDCCRQPVRMVTPGIGVASPSAWRLMLELAVAAAFSAGLS